MKAPLAFSLVLLSLLACDQNSHQATGHNFTLQRILIFNEHNEMLMSREESVWAAPFLLYQERRLLKEGLDSLANTYGIRIADVELRGQFSYTYDYHPHASLRTYFVANYVSGELKIPAGLAEVKWMPIPEAIDSNSISSIKAITKQITDYPDVVWGGSFMVREDGEEHPTEQVEPFYALFERKE